MKMKMMVIVGLIFSIFALTAEMVAASPWPPETKWYPRAPNPPEMRNVPAVRNRPVYLVVGESFYLSYGWAVALYNTTYDLITGERETTPYPNLQDGTDSVYAIFTVTMDGQLIKPTYTYFGICMWSQNQWPIASGHWIVVPLTITWMYYIVFADGLPAGEYTVATCVQPVMPRTEPTYYTRILYVAEP